MNWQIDVPEDRIDLYMELKNELRSITSDEAGMLIELVDAWRGLEHAKHIALMHALEQR